MAMTNDEIADQFSMLSKLMDIHGENSFRSKGYSIAAYHVEQLVKPITEMDDAELFAAKGIGDSTGKKIREIQQTGMLDALQKIMAATPEGVLEMMSIKGLGPKKIATIWKELGIETLGELEYACTENRLAEIKGFGQKTQKSILESLSFYKKSQGFHLWRDAEETALELLEHLKKALPDNCFEITGDLRRQAETLDTIEFITTATAPQILEQFNNHPDLQAEKEPASLLLLTPDLPRLRFHFTDEESFEKTLFLTTGSADFIAAFLEKFKVADAPKSEQQIFEDNGLPYIHPALRESENVLALAAEGKLKELVQISDIKGIIHSHSTWSDGSNTIEEMAKAARDKGYEYLVISDHSVAAYYAKGLTPERIVQQHAEIDKLNAKLAPFRIFKSIEADILGDGSLDYDATILSSFDLVIASVHSNLKMTMEKAMDRVMTAIRNPFTTILGHPTGRLLLSRQGYPLDHKQVIDACAAHNVVIEINAHPRRLDLDWRWIEYAAEKGVLMSIDPDAHFISGFDDVRYGVLSAQKGGLTKDQNLSSYNLQQFEEFVAQYKAKRSSQA